jgi:hypothetical protein
MNPMLKTLIGSLAVRHNCVLLTSKDTAELTQKVQSTLVKLNVDFLVVSVGPTSKYDQIFNKLLYSTQGVLARVVIVLWDRQMDELAQSFQELLIFQRIKYQDCWVSCPDTLFVFVSQSLLPSILLDAVCMHCVCDNLVWQEWVAPQLGLLQDKALELQIDHEIIEYIAQIIRALRQNGDFRNSASAKRNLIKQVNSCYQVKIEALFADESPIPDHVHLGLHFVVGHRTRGSPGAIKPPV